MDIKLAENIKKLRIERGMTQKAFADTLMVTPQSVSRWENGQVYPDIEMLPRIAEIFKVSLDTLLMGMDLSFLQRKRKELNKARMQVKGEDDYHGRRRVCEILEELAVEGTAQTEFLSESLSLYKIDGIGVDTVERAREYCRKLLLKSSGDDRIRHLTTILLIEDPQNAERWREFVSNDSLCSCWDDLLLRCYIFGNTQSERFEPTRQRVIHDALWKLIMNLILGHPDRDCCVGSLVFQALNPCETYKLALDILDLFSAKAEDRYLDLRIYVEIRMAAALFAKRCDEEGFSMLETILEHIEIVEKWHNTMQRGAADEFLEMDLRRCLVDIDFQIRRREFDRVREDSRCVALCRCVERDAFQNDVCG